MISVGRECRLNRRRQCRLVNFINLELDKWMTTSWFKKVLFIFTLFLCWGYATFADQHVYETHGADRQVLRGGWYFWDPYQYIDRSSDPFVLTGLDVELEKLILSQAGFSVDISDVSWKQHQEDMELGKRDVAMGAFYSPQRAKYSYFTESYRFEEDSFFVLKKNLFNHQYDDVKGFIDYVKQNNLVVGVTEGYLYASDELNQFIQDPKNAKYIFKSPNDLRKLNLLMGHKIDGFLADRIAGSTVIWRQKLGHKVSEKRLQGAKAPIYMLLSRKTISEADYNRINEAVKEIKKSNDYSRIVSWYLYPVILLETTSSNWFYLIELIGIIAFALSGLVVAYRCNATLLGTVILSLLPPFGGGVMRDILIGRFPVWFLQADTYILIVLVLVGLGFVMIRYADYWKKLFSRWNQSRFFKNSDRILDSILLVTDAIGLATFTVTGVLVCMVGKTSPLWLWGPLFAFLSGAGGGMIRDFIVKGISDVEVDAINGQLYGEIALLWGGLLSMYLFLTVNDVDPSYIKFSVLFTIFMCFFTRIVVYVYQIPNIKISIGKQASVSQKG